MNRTNPLFLEDKEPVDPQGHDRNDLGLSGHGKEGFRVILRAVEDSIRQIADAILNVFSKRTPCGLSRLVSERI